MGRRAGIALSTIGFLLMLLATIILLSLLFSPPQLAGAGLGGLVFVALYAVALLVPIFMWIISHLLYLAAFLTTRRTGSKAVGSLGILAGILHILVLTAFLSRMGGGPIEESLVVLGLAAVFALIYLVVGARWLTKRPAYYYQY